MGNQTSNYNEYGCFADEVRSKENDYNNVVNRYQNQLEQNSALESQKDNEWSIKIQQAKDEYDDKRTRQETEWNTKLKEKEEVWNQQIMAEEMKLQKEIEEKQAIFKQQQQQHMQTKQIQQHHHKYKPSLSTGVYGHYVLNKIQQHHHIYKPSLSTGVYGHYALNKIEDISVSHNNKYITELDNDEKKQDISIIYEQIYAKTKEIDNKHKLIFKPECNIKGCCNKPEIDVKLLDGDMYVCKKHRIEMANKIKQCGLGGDAANDIINQLNNMNDSELLAQGQQMVNDDYFLKSYTKLKIRQNEIIKELLTLKRSQSKYWALKIEYKQIQKAMEFLVLIRKVSNPMPMTIFSIFVKHIVHIVYHCMNCGVCCRGSRDNCRAGKNKDSKERQEYERKNKARLKKLSILIDNLSSQIKDKQTMKSDCIQLIKDEQKKYDDKVTELEGKIKNLQFDEQKWITDIANEKKKHESADKAEEKKWDDQIKAKHNEIDNERSNEANKWDGWIQQKVDFHKAVDDINKEIRDAAKTIKDEQDKYNVEIEKLENDLDDETLDEAAWEKKMDRLEKLEKKRETNNKDNEKLLKGLQDKLDDKKDEEKKWGDDNNLPQTDINGLKELKQWKLTSLKTVRDKELQTLETNKQNALRALKTNKQNTITDMETKRDKDRTDLARERTKTQQELNTHKDVAKRQLDTFKRQKKEEVRQLEIEEDDLNFQKAKARAEELMRNTTDGWSAVYIVYDKRKYHNFWLKSTYSGSTSETYGGIYGNYAICRMEGKYNKRSYSAHGRNEFRFKVEGRSYYWYRFYNGDKSIGTSDGWTYVDI